MDPRLCKVPNDAPYEFQDRIQRAKLNGEQMSLVLELCSHIGGLNDEVLHLTRQLKDAGSVIEGPPGKKRKLSEERKVEEVKANVPVTTGLPSIKGMAWELGLRSFEAPDISFIMPHRKKFKLSIRPGSYSEDGGITVESTQGKPELDLAIRWKDIEQIICTAVPEKASVSYNFTIVPSAHSKDEGAVPLEPIIFAVPQALPKDARFHDGDQVQPGETWEQLIQRVLEAQLRKYGKRVSLPDSKEFESALKQAHRKNEKAYHVKAFRGASEGFLFFLSTGILFGFRKPVYFFPLHSITSVSYSSVLARTFNLNISVQLRADDSTFTISGAPASPNDPPTNKDFEFSMVDQADHNGIDKYVKGHGLHDASLAEGRRAQRQNRQLGKGIASGAPNGDVEEESELVKAERELQDAEDEEEEDFDPSDGESDGSGESSDDEGEEEAEASGKDRDEDEDLETE